MENYSIIRDEAKKEIEKLEKITIKLHPAGGFDKKNGFVYEPLGNLKYIFKLKNYKGVAEAEEIFKGECPSCGTIFKLNRKKKNSKCSCGRKFAPNKEDFVWELNTGFSNLRLIFEDTPLNKIYNIFKVPNQQAIDYWLNNFLTDENGKEVDEKFIFQTLKNHFKSFFDLPIERTYDIIALGIIQSWLVEILDVLFYLNISGETESGKTALLEGIGNLCRHGLLAANIRSAGVARCAEKYKLSLMLDEIDTQRSKDDDIEGVCRQGYRRGQFYIRMAPNSHEPEFFNVFGFKVFTYRSTISDDLQNRSFDIPMSKTKSQELPVLNLFKQFFSPYDLMFFWYLDNITQIYTQLPNFMSELSEPVNDVNTVNIYNIVNNNNNNNIITEYLRDNRISITGKVPHLLNYINLINKRPIFGRNIELAYLAYILINTLNLDANEVLVETIEQKQEMEEATQEIGWVGLLRDILIEEYPNCELKEGIKIISYKKAISKYIRRMKEIYDNIPSQYQIRKMLRQVGFIDNLNRKVIRIEGKPQLSLIYDAEIQTKLGIKEEQRSL